MEIAFSDSRIPSSVAFCKGGQQTEHAVQLVIVALKILQASHESYDQYGSKPAVQKNMSR